jgi:hypothetical protein
MLERFFISTIGAMPLNKNLKPNNAGVKPALSAFFILSLTLASETRGRVYAG